MNAFSTIALQTRRRLRNIRRKKYTKWHEGLQDFLPSIRQISPSCSFMCIGKNQSIAHIYNCISPSCFSWLFKSYNICFRKLFASGLCSDLRKPSTFMPFKVMPELSVNSITRCLGKHRHTAFLVVTNRFSLNFFHISTSTTRGSEEFTFLHFSIPKKKYR